MKKLLFLIILMFLLVAIGCGNDKKPAPVYKAHITDMALSGATGTTAKAALSSAILTAATTTSTSVQDFYSGDLLVNTLQNIDLSVSVQNDSDVPMSVMMMTYWAPTGYPYPDTWFNKSIFQWCGGIGDPLAPGEIRNITTNWGIGMMDPSLLGPQEISVYIYASNDPNINHDLCQPDPWDGTLAGMTSFIQMNAPVAKGTNHFTVVESLPAI